MWLPKDERKLLRCYFLALGEIDREERFSGEDLVRFLSCQSMRQLTERVRKWREGTIEGKTQQIKQTVEELYRVSVANKALQK